MARQVNAALRCLQSLHRIMGLPVLCGAASVIDVNGVFAGWIPNISLRFPAEGTDKAGFPAGAVVKVSERVSGDFGKVLGRVATFGAGGKPEKT